MVVTRSEDEEDADSDVVVGVSEDVEGLSEVGVLLLTLGVLDVASVDVEDVVGVAEVSVGVSEEVEVSVGDSVGDAALLLDGAASAIEKR